MTTLTHMHAHTYHFSLYYQTYICSTQQHKRNIKSKLIKEICFKDMEVSVELEDDLFYADLSKQISLLIMDEDEDPLASSPAHSLQTFSGAIHPPPQSAFIYEQLALRRSQIKGTGVFIPQSTQVPRRKHRKGRSSAYAKSQKQSQDTRMVSQISDK